MKISNGKKSPAKGIGLVIIKIPKSNIIIPLFNILYATKSSKYNQSNITQTLQPIQKR